MIGDTFFRVWLKDDWKGRELGFLKLLEVVCGFLHNYIY
jgi:hypothetical protein